MPGIKWEGFGSKPWDGFSAWLEASYGLLANLRTLGFEHREAARLAFGLPYGGVDARD